MLTVLSLGNRLKIVTFFSVMFKFSTTNRDSFFNQMKLNVGYQKNLSRPISSFLYQQEL